MAYHHQALWAKTKMLEIMPQKNFSPDFISYYISLIFIAIAGICGSLVLQIHGPKRKFSIRLLELLAGALCAVYGAEIVSLTLYHGLEKFDFISKDSVAPEKIIGLAGFLCGAVGVAILEHIIEKLRKKTK